MHFTCYYSNNILKFSKIIELGPTPNFPSNNTADAPIALYPSKAIFHFKYFCKVEQCVKEQSDEITAYNLLALFT